MNIILKELLENWTKAVWLFDLDFSVCHAVLHQARSTGFATIDWMISIGCVTLAVFKYLCHQDPSGQILTVVQQK